MKFEPGIDLKTATEIGLTLSPALLSRTNRVIRGKLAKRIGNEQRG